jgi:hypothetical protein
MNPKEHLGTPSEQGDHGRYRRSLRKSVLIPLIAGLIILGNVGISPRFASFHTVDVVGFLASGVCFGIALARLVASHRANALKAGA